MKMNKLLKAIVNSRLWNFILIRFCLPNILKLVDEKFKTALEIGCGIGATTKKLVKHFPKARLIAIDYDSLQAARARKELANFQNIEIEEADATNLPFAAETFDAVFVFNTLHHIQNYEEAVKEISRVLKQGGFLYLMDEGRTFFNPVFKFIDRPEALFTKNQIKEISLKFNLKYEKGAGGEKIFYLAFKKIG